MTTAAIRVTQQICYNLYVLKYYLLVNYNLLRNLIVCVCTQVLKYIVLRSLYGFASCSTAGKCSSKVSESR